MDGTGDFQTIFPHKDLESSNWNNHLYMVVLGFQVDIHDILKQSPTYLHKGTSKQLMLYSQQTSCFSLRYPHCLSKHLNETVDALAMVKPALQMYTTSVFPVHTSRNLTDLLQKNLGLSVTNVKVFFEGIFVFYQRFDSNFKQRPNNRRVGGGKGHPTHVAPVPGFGTHVKSKPSLVDAGDSEIQVRIFSKKLVKQKYL